METPSHAGVEFPVAAIGAVKGSFEFKPQASVVTQLSRDAGTYVVPCIMVALIEVQVFQTVEGNQVEGAVSGKFMEDVGFEVPRCMGVKVFSEAEA